MNTVFILMAQYGATAVVPIELVCRDYFSHLNPQSLVTRITRGDIKLPLVRMDRSQKCSKGVAITDLARYLDDQIDAGRHFYKQMHGRPFGT